MLRAISTHETLLVEIFLDIPINANEVIVYNNSETACLFDGEYIGPYEEIRWGSVGDQLVIYEKTVKASAIPQNELVTLIVKQILFQQV